jgi:3-methyladenine DNA glycosylase AlkD
LRWTGKVPIDNADTLITIAEETLDSEHPSVQWAMNFALAWIGIYEPHHRERCVSLGERIGLYKEEKVPKGCTPNYLPEFIRIESEKRK